MHKITLLCIGSFKSPWIKEGCTEYFARIMGFADLQIVELPDGKSKDPEKQRIEESNRLLEAIEKRSGEVWVLDERGEGMASKGFADALGDAQDLGQEILFVLGGAHGLSDTVRERADWIIALSQMTFPHELCRMIFLEQLYRALQIGRGSGYHH